MMSPQARDDWTPHDDARSAAQIDWLRGQCANRDVLDLGCGGGRIAAELAAGASSWQAVDSDAQAVAACAAAAPKAKVAVGDLRAPWHAPASFDVVLLLGNRLCLLWDVDEAVDAMDQWRRLLRPGGMLVVDDIPDDLWPELAEGHWCAGLDETEGRQLVWAADDAVFAVRSGDDVDAGNWTLGGGDSRMRLWTAGALRLAARASGFGPPARERGAGVLVLRPATNDRAV